VGVARLSDPLAALALIGPLFLWRGLNFLSGGCVRGPASRWQNGSQVQARLEEQIGEG